MVKIQRVHIFLLNFNYLRLVFNRPALPKHGRGRKGHGNVGESPSQTQYEAEHEPRHVGEIEDVYEAEYDDEILPPPPP
jgi:hypothetical protein